MNPMVEKLAREASADIFCVLWEEKELNAQKIVSLFTPEFDKLLTVLQRLIENENSVFYDPIAFDIACELLKQHGRKP